MGISWQVLSNDFDVNVDFSSFADNASPLGSFGVGNLANDDWEGVVQALLTDGDTQVIATPKILVVDGQEGVFTSTRDEPYTVVVTDANTRTTLEDVRFLNLGVTLAVVPTINQLGLINIVVQLEISSLVEIRDGIPVADRSTAQSSVTVLNGGSVILGGLRQRERGETFNRVPMFSRLPLLGRPFQERSHRQRRTRDHPDPPAADHRRDGAPHSGYAPDEARDRPVHVGTTPGRADRQSRPESLVFHTFDRLIHP